MNEDVEFIKTFVETMLLSEICEQDTIQGMVKPSIPLMTVVE